MRQQVEQRLAAEEQRVAATTLVAARQQLAGDERADVAGTAGDQDRLRFEHCATSESAGWLVSMGSACQPAVQ